MIKSVEIFLFVFNAMESLLIALFMTPCPVKHQMESVYSQATPRELEVLPVLIIGSHNHNISYANDAVLIADTVK